MNLLRKAADALALGLGAMACFAMAALVILLTLEMVARSAFDHSFDFAWEYASYGVGILIFGGLGWTLRTGGHIRVTALQNLLTPGQHRAIESLAHLLGSALATILAIAMVQLCRTSFVDQTRSFLATETLLYIPQIFIALGAIGFAMQAWLRLFLHLAGQPVDIKAARIESAQSHV